MASILSLVGATIPARFKGPVVINLGGGAVLRCVGTSGLLAPSRPPSQPRSLCWPQPLFICMASLVHLQSLNRPLKWGGSLERAQTLAPAFPLKFNLLWSSTPLPPCDLRVTLDTVLTSIYESPLSLVSFKRRFGPKGCDRVPK